MVRATAMKIWYARSLTIGRRVLIDRQASMFLLDGGTARIADWVHIGREVELQVRGGSVSVGAGTGINAFSRIVAFERIDIGERCAIAQFVTIIDHHHAYSPERRIEGYRTRPILIGDDVWIGDKATILAGVTIGAGAIIGAGSVVTRDVAPGSVVAGAPARPIGHN